MKELRIELHAIGGHSMRVIVFGATGMVGQGVLRECLLDPDVESVLAIGRSASGKRARKAAGARRRGRDGALGHRAGSRRS